MELFITIFLLVGLVKFFTLLRGALGFLLTSLRARNLKGLKGLRGSHCIPFPAFRSDYDFTEVVHHTQKTKPDSYSGRQALSDRHIFILFLGKNKLS